MKYRIFPGTALSVSEIGFGTWTLSTGWWGEKTDDEVVAMLRSAHDDFGITFFDAADSYGNGRAERQLATAFRGRRDLVVYATKIGYDIYDDTQLSEFAAASDKPDLDQEQVARVADLAAVNFGVDEDPMSYKGTMERVAS